MPDTLAIEFSAIVKLFEVVEADGAGVVFVTGRHNVCDVLVVHGMVQVF